MRRVAMARQFGRRMTDTKTLAARAALIVCAGLSMGLCLPAIAQDNDRNAQDFAKRIDPTDFKHRFDLRNEYFDFSGGEYVNQVVPRGEYAVSRTLAFRAELPIVTYDSGQPGAGTDFGIGNLLTRVAWRAARTESYAFVMGTEAIFDTASRDTLGQSKNVVAPFAFMAIELPRWNSIFFPYIQYYHSVSGDDAQPDVRVTNPRTSLLTRWPKRTYTFVEASYFIDHERSDRVGATLKTELGRFYTSNTGLYVRPGIGLYRNDLPQVFNWSMEIGMRHLF